MTRFVGSLVLSFILAGGTLLVLRSLPDLARYLKLREM